MTAKNKTAISHMITPMAWSFSSWNSTARSSARFWSAPKPVSRSFRSEASKPDEAGSELSILPSIDQHSQEDTDPEGNSNRFVRVAPDRAIGGLGTGDCLFLN